MSWSEMRRLLVCVSLALITAGCGFRAHTAAELPASIQSVHIDTVDRYSMFYRELTTRLTARGLNLVSDPGRADATIRVTSDQTDQRVVAVSPQNKPREYDVYYSVTYSVLMNGATVLEPQTIFQNQSYNYDETEVLGKALEADSLRKALARDLVGRVIRRMSTIG